MTHDLSRCHQRVPPLSAFLDRHLKSHSKYNNNNNSNNSNNNNNNKSIYIAPWFQVTLFKGAVRSKKNSKKKICAASACHVAKVICNEKLKKVLVMTTWNMEEGGHGKIGGPKLKWSDVIRKYMKEKQDRSSIRPENVEIENWTGRPQRPKKKKQVTKRLCKVKKIQKIPKKIGSGWVGPGPIWIKKKWKIVQK